MQLRDNPGRLIQELEEQARGVRDQFSDLLGVADAVTGFATEVRDALTEIKTLLIAVRDSNIEPIRYEDAQVETLIRRVRVTTAGTALVDENGTLKRFDFLMIADKIRLVARGEVHETELVMEVDQLVPL